MNVTATVNVFFVKPPIYAQGITLSRLCNATGRDVLTLFEIMTSVSENPTDCRISMSQGPDTDMYDGRMPYLEARKTVCDKPVRSLLLR